MRSPDPASVKRKTAGGIALLALALTLASLALRFLPSGPSRSAWQGFRVLLVEVSVPEDTVLSRLSAAGIGEVLSESTEPVLVSNWSGLESMSLAEARSRLLPVDPRFDDYLGRLGLWFETGGYRVYYLKSSSPFGSDAGLKQRIAAALGDSKGRFLLPESGGSVCGERREAAWPLAAALLLLCGAAAGPLIGKSAASLRSLSLRKPGLRCFDRIAFRLSLGMPWAILAIGGLESAAIAALWGLALIELAEGLDTPLDEFRKGGKLRAVLRAFGSQAPLPLALVAAAILSLLIAPSMLIAVCLALFASIMACFGYALASMSLASRLRFTPLPIFGGGLFVRRRLSPPGLAATARAALATFTILAWAFCAFLFPGGLTPASSPIAYPAPIETQGSLKPLPSEARIRSPSEKGKALPGIASYLEHRAIQEALPYMPVGEERPDPFQSLALPSRSANVKRLVFDDAWARSVYKSVPALSIEGMLLGQAQASVGQIMGTVSAITYYKKTNNTERPAGQALGRSGKGGPLAPIECLLYIFLLIPPLGRLFVGIPFAHGRVAESSELRQEA